MARINKKKQRQRITILVVGFAMILGLIGYGGYSIIHLLTGNEKKDDAKQTEKGTSTKKKEEDEVQEMLDSMSIQEKVSQMFIVTPEQLENVTDDETYITEATSTTESTLQTYPVGGIIFFANNIESPEQVTSYISTAQSYSKISLFISVDEEGGEVSRIGNNEAMGTTQFSSMSNCESEEEAYSIGNTIGTEISQFGFNYDFAPVADVNSNPDNPIIGNRAFSDDPNVAASYVSSCVKGFQDANVICCLKHFPGHGDTSTDTHLEKTYLNKSVEELQQCEWIPFQAALNADSIMVSHIVVPDITGDTPSSLSYEMVTNYLKNTLGYSGLCVTDSLKMEAISQYYSSGDAAVMAIEAGEDIILMPENLEEAINGVLAAIESGDISEERINESVYKILKVKKDKGIIE